MCASGAAVLGALPRLLCPQGLRWGWLEKQEGQNGDSELRNSASGVR